MFKGLMLVYQWISSPRYAAIAYGEIDDQQKLTTRKMPVHAVDKTRPGPIKKDKDKPTHPVFGVPKRNHDGLK